MQATPVRGGAGDSVRVFVLRDTEERIVVLQSAMVDTQPVDPELPPLKPEDIQYFDKLLAEVDEASLTVEQKKEREIMTYLLKIKNGTGPIRKSGLRMLTREARRLGAGPLFNQILPLLMSPSLEDQERHL